MFPPDAHDEIWAIQRTLDFAGTVAGVDTGALAGESAMSALTATYAALYGRHRDDRVLATDLESDLERLAGLERDDLAPRARARARRPGTARAAHAGSAEGARTFGPTA